MTANPPRFRPLALACVLLAVAGCGTPGPDGPSDTYGLDFRLPEGSIRTPAAIVFFVDGVNAAVFEEMLDAGELPAIRHYFVDRGLYVRRGVADVPSVTLANLTSFVTGRFPGHHGVTGINWFDRNTLVWRNYETIAQKNTLDGDYVAPTVYEQFPTRTTISVFFQPHRGTTKFIENWTSAGPPYYFGWYEFVDRLTLFRFHLVNEIARARAAAPAVTIAYLLAPDFFAYENGASDPRYRDAMRHTDYQIGRVLGDLERAGRLDETVIAFVTDHGMMDVERHWVLPDYLRDELGLHLSDARLWEKSKFEERLAHYRQYTAVYYGSGDRYAAICLRRPTTDDEGTVTGFEPWTRRPTPANLAAYPVAKTDGLARLCSSTRMPSGHAKRVNLPAMLAAREEVDVVAHAAGPDRVRVRRRDGEVEFRAHGGPRGTISYHLVSGDDPLGYAGVVPSELLSGEPASRDAWFRATAGSGYPDLPEQILAYFRARRAGDVVLFAAPGWDFRDVHSAGHGGLRPGEMHVPILLAGPGVPARQVRDHARLVDVMPTLLKLLGRNVPHGVDGRPLTE